MKNNPKLYQKIIAALQKDTFYRQRFDACPHFMSFIGQAHTSTAGKGDYPYSQQTAYCRFSKNRADWYHSNNQLEHTAAQMIERLKIDKNFGADLTNIAAKKAKIFYGECEKINKIELSKLSQAEIKRVYASLKSKYLSKLFVSPLIDGFALATDYLLYEKISTSLEKKGFKDQINSYFEILTAPSFISFQQTEELELLKGLARVRKNEIDLRQFIKKHQLKFFWIHNNYVNDNILNDGYFSDRAKKFLKDDNIEKKMNQIVSVEKNRERKSLLIKEMGIDGLTARMIFLTDQLNYLQDERKRSTFWATHYFSLILAEAAERINYPVESVKYSVPSEFELLLEGKISLAELKNRFKDCIVLWNKNEYEIITDFKKIKILDSIACSEEKKGVAIKGLAAFIGKVIGPVKILESSRDIKKIQEGDIIVAVMTRPDYAPAMKKAAAFVTDEGGITCHAAIIAREMKKPCIIGTKIATKVLKDGDLVEVDAERGIVKILKKSKT